MMEDANKGKPKKEWKPPKGYKSAIGKARDAAKAKRTSSPRPIKSMVHSADDRDDDTASQISEYSASGRSFQMGHQVCAALMPKSEFTSVTRVGYSASQARDFRTAAHVINSVNKFEGLADEQEYDPEMIQSLKNWAAKVSIAPMKKSKKKMALLTEPPPSCTEVTQLQNE